MKILHILTDSNTGGAGILLENLLRYTELPKEEIAVILPRGAAMLPRYEALGIRCLPLLTRKDRSFAPADLPRLTACLRREKPDIVHTHAALGGRIAAFAARVPIRIATRHCAYPDTAPAAAVRHALNRLGDAVLTHTTIATAEAAAENLRALGIPARKITRIPNGARALRRLSDPEKRDLRLQLGLREGDFVVGLAARLSPVKGHSALLDAAEILLSQHTGYRFLLVGGGPEEAAIRKRIAAPPLCGQVLMVGEVTDVAPYVNLFDVALSCSTGTETASLALSEAMSLGIPCIASDFGGNPEMVRPGENGLLFPAGNAPALAACIERIRTDRALYASLSAGAIARYRRAGRAEDMAAAYDRLYRTLYAEKMTVRRSGAEKKHVTRT